MFYCSYNVYNMKSITVVIFPVGGGGAVALGGAHFQKFPHGSLLREYFGFQRATGATAPPPAPPFYSFWVNTKNELHSFRVQFDNQRHPLHRQ